jgi:hypothetical protein
LWPPLIGILSSTLRPDGRPRTFGTMRGIVALVGFGLLFAACADPVKDQTDQGEQTAGTGGSSGKGGAAGHPGAQEPAGEAGATEAGAGGQVGEAGEPEPSTGGDAGAAGSTDSGGGGTAQGGAGGGASVGGSSGSPAGGKGGSGPTNQCAGFTEYEVEPGTCLVATGDYQQQTDSSCSAGGIVSRDHCATCTTWTSLAGTMVVRLSNGAPTKVLSLASGACPSGCKYICN